MYVHDDRLAPKLDQSTFGIGGKLALQTPQWNGWRVKGAYYVTDDLGTRSSNPKKTDAYMFDVDKKPYSVLGEAVVEYKNGDSTLLLGRQEIDTPIVSTYDYRIIPNLFEAYTYTNRTLPHTSLTLSYITKMSGLDGLVSFKHFESMSQQTYTSLLMVGLSSVDSDDGETVDISKISGHRGVVMSGFVYDNTLKVQGWNYYCHDVIDEWYTDIAYPYPLDERFSLIFEAQGYGVRSLGKFDRFLGTFGLEGDYELYGAKLSLKDNQGWNASIAYNAFTGNDKTVTAFGNWGGYPEYVSIPYMFAQGEGVSALAKSRMGKVNLSIDLSGLGWENQTFIIGYALIDLDEQIMPQSDIDVVNLVYKAKLTQNIGIKAQYEMRESDNYRYANDMLTLSATYRF